MMKPHSPENDKASAIKENLSEEAKKIYYDTQHQLRETKKNHGLGFQNFNSWNMRQQDEYGDLPARVISAARRLLEQEPLEDYFLDSYAERRTVLRELYSEISGVDIR